VHFVKRNNKMSKNDDLFVPEESDGHQIPGMSAEELKNLRWLVQYLPFPRSRPKTSGQGQLMSIELWPGKWYSLVDILVGLAKNK